MCIQAIASTYTMCIQALPFLKSNSIQHLAWSQRRMCICSGQNEPGWKFLKICWIICPNFVNWWLKGCNVALWLTSCCGSSSLNPWAGSKENPSGRFLESWISLTLPLPSWAFKFWKGLQVDQPLGLPRVKDCWLICAPGWLLPL